MSWGKGIISSAYVLILNSAGDAK